MQNFFPDAVATRSKILTFHDESGSFGCDRWILMGILWVDSRYSQEIVDALIEIRENHNYWRKIHFNEFPSTFSGFHNQDVRVARDWLDIYLSSLSKCAWFNVLAMDTGHAMYEHKRFRRNFHAYNRFCRIAFHAGLVWHFKGFPSLQLEIYSDNKVKRPGGLLGDGLTSDNFEQYLVDGLLQDIHSNPKIPPVKLSGPVACLSIPKVRSKEEITPQEELLQLCDVLTGSVASALVTKSVRQTKFWFGKRIAPFILDTRKPPWEQVYGLHRRFSVSYFPNNQGKIYNNGPLRILNFSGQESLFS